jgi:hypothetical protein
VSTEPRAAEILERWRALERELSGFEPDSIQAQLIRIEAGQLRDKYRQLVDDGQLPGVESIPALQESDQLETP